MQAEHEKSIEWDQHPGSNISLMHEKLHQKIGQNKEDEHYRAVSIQKIPEGENNTAADEKEGSKRKACRDFFS